MDKGSICKIRDIYRAISELESVFEKRFGLNLNETIMLCTLNERNGITSGELTEALGLTHSNTSKVIRAVETRKFVKRTFDKDDKRIVHFNITMAGKEQLERMSCDEIEIPKLLQTML